MINIQSKLPDVGTNIFTVMSSLAAEKNAVNLGQGFPDFPMSEELTSLVTQAMNRGYNQYAHMAGYLPLRESIAEKVQELYACTISPDTQVTVTPGGTYAIYTALTATLRPGDEVIVFEPCYDSYIPNIVVNGAIPKVINLTIPGYRIDWQQVKAAITDRTRMIMLNSPHNPTGSILHEEDMRQLIDLVKNTRILVLSDEVYEHLIFDDLPHLSILRYPELLERSFVCFSFGKVYHCTGWKLGYCISVSELMKEFRKVHQFNCFSCHTPAQVALATFLQNKESYATLGSFMQQKRDYFQMQMKSTKFTALPSYGSYFQCCSYENISNESDKEFAIRLASDYGVASIPVSAFYHTGKDDHVIRFCFAKKEETIDQAIEKLLLVK